ncbi:hypothetical protein Acsp03_39510 [Actinomadura sp. NBRC 104412]|nr:DUF397 domain-containing protein [Actinomadura sp. NBRC 104412]GLZ06485.1 hypothetical protein Acsp03_39510 [Actinomadura sp. NBRC 104412]
MPGLSAPLEFRRASRCETLNQTGCVEVAKGPGFVAVRDSTDRGGAVLAVSPEAWRRLVRQMTRRMLVHRLPCDATAASRARRVLRGELAHYPAGLLDDVVLCTCETVTNAVLHSGTAPCGFLVLVVETFDRLRVEVLDEGNGAGSVLGEEAGLFAEGGRGLFIVAELSAAMGVYADGAGQNVWFEMDLSSLSGRPGCGLGRAGDRS